MMSMAWMRMPGQSWLAAAASFTAMWAAMMVAMMLPSLVPMLRRYREAVGGSSARALGLPTTIVGFGYFSVWTVFGVVIFPLGVAFAAAEMRYPALARAVPIMAGVVVLAAGGLQCTSWKAHQLACCGRCPASGRLSTDTGTAWQHGLRLGLQCSYCCSGLMAVLLVVGVMDLRAMGLVTAAITLERLAPSGARIARAIGIVIVGAGMVLIVKAAGIA
jgi:predicted metal-binding membrane protein